MSSPIHLDPLPKQVSEGFIIDQTQLHYTLWYIQYIWALFCTWLLYKCLSLVLIKHQWKADGP